MTDTATQPITVPTTVSLSAVPALGTPLADGHFAGLTTLANGTHVAVVLLPGQATDVTWAQAKEWATTTGGELPTRHIADLLYANCKSSLKPEWHWTSEEYEYGASYAWTCDFGYGDQNDDRKSCEGSAVAVRLIPLIP